MLTFMPDRWLMVMTSQAAAAPAQLGARIGCPWHA